MTSKVKRKVTVENTKDNPDQPRRPSVFERLGPGAINVASQSSDRHSRIDHNEKCRNWLRTGTCSYGNVCRFQHNTFATPTQKHSQKGEKSGKVKESRHKAKKSKDEPKDPRPTSSSPKRKSRKRSGSRSRKGEHEGKIKSTVVVTRPRSPTSSANVAAPAEPADDKKKKVDASWEEDSDDWPMDAAQLDYKEELTLERKRQQLQRELAMISDNPTASESSSSSSSSDSGSISSTTDSSSSSSEDDSDDSSSSSSSSSSSTSQTPIKKKYKKSANKKEASAAAKKLEGGRKKPLDDYDKIKSSRLAKATAAAAATRILSPVNTEKISRKKSRDRRVVPSPAASPKRRGPVDASVKGSSHTLRKGPRTPSPPPPSRKQRPWTQSSSADSRAGETRKSQKKKHKKKKDSSGKSERYKQNDHMPFPQRISSPNRIPQQSQGPPPSSGKKSWPKHDSGSKSYQRTHDQSPLVPTRLSGPTYSPGNRHAGPSPYGDTNKHPGKHGKSKNKSKKSDNAMHPREGGRDRSFKHARLSPAKAPPHGSISPRREKYEFESGPRKMYASPLSPPDKERRRSMSPNRHNKEYKKLHLEPDKRRDIRENSPRSHDTRHDPQYRSSNMLRSGKKGESKLKRLISPELKKGGIGKGMERGLKERNVDHDAWSDDHRKGSGRLSDGRGRLEQPPAPLPLRNERNRERDRKKGKERDLPPLRDDLERDRRLSPPLRKGPDIHPHHDDSAVPGARGRAYDRELLPEDREFPYSYGPHPEPPGFLDDRSIPPDFEADILRVPPLYPSPGYSDPLYRRDGLKEPAHIERIGGYGARGLSPIDPHPLPRDDDFLDLPLNERRPYDEQWGRNRPLRDDWDTYGSLPPELPLHHVGPAIDEDRYGMPRRRRASPEWHMHRDDREMPLRDRRSRSPQHRRGDEGPPPGRGPWRNDRPPERHGNRNNNNRSDTVEKNQDDRKDRNYRRDRKERTKKDDAPNEPKSTQPKEKAISNKRPHSPSPVKKDVKKRREDPIGDSISVDKGLFQWSCMLNATSKKKEKDEGKPDSKSSSSSRKTVKAEPSSPKSDDNVKHTDKRDSTDKGASGKSAVKQEADGKKKHTSDSKVDDDFSDWSDGDDDLLNRDFNDSESNSGEKETTTKGQSKTRKEKKHRETPDHGDSKENASSRKKRDISRDSRIRTNELRSESRSRTGSKERSSENSLTDKIDVVNQSSKESESSEPYVVKDEAVGEPDDFVTTESVDYDPISDDELEAMIEDPADSPVKASEENDEPKIVDALDINWSTLMSDSKTKPDFIPGTARKRFKTAHLLSRIGFSQALAGADLSEKLINFCQQQLDEEKDKEDGATVEQKFQMEHQIAAFHVSLAEKKKERQSIFDKVGPSRRALCARQDLYIRRFLSRPTNKLIVRSSCGQLVEGKSDATERKLKAIENQPAVVNAAC